MKITKEQIGEILSEQEYYAGNYSDYIIGFEKGMLKALTLTNVGKRSELFYCFNKQNKKLDKCMKQCSTCKEMKLMQ